ncbi:MAG: hypothetical protein N4A41_09680 [Crocinitomicaceae bacterium]|jgi:hypothetical protein|nr:hypothetical protein [Crocinitomicaceae bacterium]
MKKIVLFTILSLLFIACSKETRYNRKIEGDWVLLDIGGEVQVTDIEFQFRRENKTNGKGAIVVTENGSVTKTAFIYSMEEDKIILTFLDGETHTLRIDNLKKDEMNLIDVDLKYDFHFARK